jgi:integration host factor subunit alpha
VGDLRGAPALSAGRRGRGILFLSAKLYLIDIDCNIAFRYRSAEGVGGSMTGSTVTRAQLSEAVYQEVGLSRNESADLVENVLNEISETLVRGQTVKISSFGSFSVRHKGERKGRNPKTGEEVPIKPRRVLVFRASNILKLRISGSLNPADEEPSTPAEPGGDNSGSL